MMRLAQVYYLLAAAYVVSAVKLTPKTPMIKLPDSTPEKSIEKHIINGVAAKENQLPFQAALLITKSSGNFICGGSLINASWVLTAAHCVDGATQVVVRLGSLSRSSGGTTLTSTEFYQHESYNGYLNHDIALIKLPTPAEVGKTIKTIKVIKPLAKASSCGSKLLKLQISGWGLTKDLADSGTVSDALMVTSVTEISNFECIQSYGPQVISPTTICAKGNPSESTCSGDSGGPLTTGGTSPVLIGVVSFVSSSGCSKGFPSGYVRVTPYFDWIRLITGMILV